MLYLTLVDIHFANDLETLSQGDSILEKKLRILLVGGSGTLGKAVARELSARHEILVAGRSNGSLNIDITDIDSMRKAFSSMPKLDAVVCAAGSVKFAPLADIQAAPFSDSAYSVGITNKLLGQVNLALLARDHLNENGSITLTTGILSDHPIAAGSSATMVNRAIEGFVVAAATELPRGIRINVVSPNVLVESMEHYAPFFRGFEPVPAARAALAFSRSVEGRETGQVYKVY